MILETGIAGGQVASTFTIANYPGTDGDIKGMELAENMKKTAIAFGTQIMELQEITDINLEEDKKIVTTTANTYTAKSIILATGSTARKLDVAEESRYRGKGIHYCATCDGPFYQDTNIVVVGGGISALEEAIFLTRFAKNITIINKNPFFKAPKLYIDDVSSNSQIQLMYNSKIQEVFGGDFVNGVNVIDLKNGSKTKVDIDGIFVYIGAEANTAFLKDKLDLSQNGYIKTDEDLMTNIPGVFAAGDVRDKKVRQITTAVGDGTIAGVLASQYVYGK